MLQVVARTDLNFNAPFTVKYTNQFVLEFPLLPSGSQLTVSPEDVSFSSNVAIGASEDKTFTVTNTGTAPLLGGMTLIASDSSGNVFTLVSGDTINLGAGQSQTVTVRYSPVSPDSVSGSVRISTNGGTKTILLKQGGLQLSVEPPNLDFGSVQRQSTTDRTFTVTNSGQGTLTGSVSTTAPFSIVSGGSFSLTASQSQTVTVRFTAPNTTGPANGTATVTSNGGSATVSLTATVIGDPKLCVDPTSLDFGQAAAGSTKDLSITAKNCGGGTLTGSVSTTAPFSIVSGGSFSLAANQSQTVSVRFTAPSTAGSISGAATITSNGGSATVSLTATVTDPNPKLCVDTTSLDFGTVSVGSTKDLPVTVRNCGGQTLTGSASVGAPFSIVSGGSFSLAANQSQTVTVRFSPTAKGGFTGSVSVSSNGGPASVNLKGTGEDLLPPPPCGSNQQLASGVVTSCEINPLGEIDKYNFTLASNGHVVLQVDSPGFAINPCLEVFTAQGTAVEGGAGCSGGPSTRLDLTLTAGTYFVLVSDQSNNNTGGYNLQLTGL